MNVRAIQNQSGRGPWAWCCGFDGEVSPGEWEVISYGDPPFYEIDNEDDCLAPGIPRKADAYVMAASKDLLAACEAQKNIIRAQSDMLVAYRVGGRPSSSTASHGQIRGYTAARRYRHRQGTPRLHADRTAGGHPDHPARQRRGTARGRPSFQPPPGERGRADRPGCLRRRPGQRDPQQPAQRDTAAAGPRIHDRLGGRRPGLGRELHHWPGFPAAPQWADRSKSDHGVQPDHPARPGAGIQRGDGVGVPGDHLRGQRVARQRLHRLSGPGDRGERLCTGRDRVEWGGN